MDDFDAPVEQATAAPGEKRHVCRQHGILVTEVDDEGRQVLTFIPDAVVESR